MKDKRYHGFIIEYHPSSLTESLGVDKPYLVIPYTQRQIGGRRYYHYSDRLSFGTHLLALDWGNTWKEQGL